ncbi:MAG: phage baseplate assembly protein [Ruminococcus sp.]|nr:phage baseplate assembly protein [Ruminococcus sp.]
MWLLDYITKNSLKSAVASKGDVTSTDTNSVNVNSAFEHRNVPIVAPFGVYYNPPVGEESLVVPVNGSYVSIGVVSNEEHELSSGELMLCSKGGAKIVLKNDGSVVINGKVF